MFDQSETTTAFAFTVPVWLFGLALFLAGVAFAVGYHCLDDDGNVRKGRKVPVYAAMSVGAPALLTIAVSIFAWVMYAYTANDRAVEVLEDRYDVTIDNYLYSERPGEWRIDDMWRDCYLSDDDPANADKADLLCETPIDGQAPYTKIEPTK